VRLDMTEFIATKAIPGPSGTLELACALPNSEPSHLALICHPHPLFGGSMGNKVVTTLERCFRDQGAATVRFNFRGVGQSSGIFDQGLGESDDLQAVYAFSREFLPNLPLVLAGFSFGSFVAARMANALQTAQLISIAPPVQSWDFQTIDAPHMPWLVVQGEQDEVVAPEAVYRFAAAQKPAPTLQRLPDATHFFHGKLLELRSVVTEWQQAQRHFSSHQ
jgi:uncharacterized protein